MMRIDSMSCYRVTLLTNFEATSFSELLDRRKNITMNVERIAHMVSVTLLFAESHVIFEF